MIEMIMPLVLKLCVCVCVCVCVHVPMYACVCLECLGHIMETLVKVSLLFLLIMIILPISQIGGLVWISRKIHK